MLSVLIPVYNFDIRNLIENLSIQASELSIPYEIIVIDDDSDMEFKILNKKVTDYKGVSYYEESENIGRSKIRNKLADLARFNNLLFLDCDSSIEQRDFLKKYIDHIGESNVIYGGRKYEFAEPVPDQFRLHWLYGIKREQITAYVRTNEPNKSFMTNNFLISKEAFNKVRFNENLKGYGHEDTLFGYELLKSDITIKHIDNPAIHIGLESGEEFLRKTCEGIENLIRIIKINGSKKQLVKDIKLLSYCTIIKKLKLEKFAGFIFSKMENKLRKNLLGKSPSLICFDLYKLGYMCSQNGKVH